MRLSLIALVLSTTVGLVGCASSSVLRSGYPRYWASWSELPVRDREAADYARNSLVDDVDDVDRLLTLARHSARMAHLQAESWLRLDGSAENSDSSRRMRAARARSRMLQACRYTLSLYRQAELRGATLGWREQLECAWLNVLQGDEEAAEQLLESVRGAAETPISERSAVDAILSRLRDDPSGKRSTGRARGGPAVLSPHDRTPVAGGAP